jgi:hypothetical protein
VKKSEQVLKSCLFIGSLCMMNGPKCVEGGERQETLASLLVAVLVLGIGRSQYIPVRHHNIDKKQKGIQSSIIEFLHRFVGYLYR